MENIKEPKFGFFLNSVIITLYLHVLFDNVLRKHYYPYRCM